jgi:gamma-glutamylcyclotransferase (GGCT)/AIG2-like uncharacterized protein YtfP
MYIFVYGTLMTGYGNNYLLDQNQEGVTFIGKAVSKDSHYFMVDVGFPMVFDPTYHDDEFPMTNHIGKIKGELYFVTNPEVLSNLDSLEGHPRWYVRTESDFHCMDEVVPAQYYRMQDLDYTNSEAVIPNEDGVLDWSDFGARATEFEEELLYGS